jgi:three-Cys-motif partner protein
MALERLPHLDDDGLVLPEFGAWAETKYRLIANYSQMFATSMKEKWDMRVYLDLFAAAGRARIKGGSEIIPTSATLALNVRDPFDRYVLCEIEPELLNALRERCRRDGPSLDVRYVPGDCNAQVQRILGEIPARNALCFCVADPRAISDLKFATIEALAGRFVDFLVLIPSYMDAHRNQDLYLAAENPIMQEYLGDPAWRDDWKRSSGAASREFGAFVVDRFGQAMKKLRYLYDGPDETVAIRDAGRLLYHLCFFSRSPLGRKFWHEARKYSQDQLTLL